MLDIHFSLDTEITVKQEQFLSNGHNKSRQIDLLRSNLHENGIETFQASDDADMLIITTAIDKSETSTVAVIGEDVDLAVLLMAKTPADRDILFVKPGRGKVKTNIYSTKQMQQLGLKDILFLHAFTGCDTTSAAFRRSKVGFIKLYQKHPDVRKAAEVFSSPFSSQTEVWEAGNKCMLTWYGASTKETSLNLYRYQSFLRSLTKIKADISSLPPTEGAAKEHSFRTYHQVQIWLGNNLSPELWGWERKAGNQLVPVHSKNLAAPEEILKLIFCRCTKDCSSNKCGCRKASMNCSHLCQNCQGNCLNGVPMFDNEDDDTADIEPVSTIYEEAEAEENIDEKDDSYEAPTEPIAGHSCSRRAKTFSQDLIAD